jgi:hypothetical protein
MNYITDVCSKLVQLQTLMVYKSVLLRLNNQMKLPMLMKIVIGYIEMIHQMKEIRGRTRPVNIPSATPYGDTLAGKFIGIFIESNFVQN